MAKIIKLNHGKEAIIDDDLFEELINYKWIEFKTRWGTYVARLDCRKIIFMHRQILNAPVDMTVDHINRNTLDNRKSNLRLATMAENNRNKNKYKNNKSGLKGVYLVRGNRWRATITVNKKTIHIGYFHDIEDAAKAYDQAAIYHFGEFARTNY